jgi:hypothetical protein
MRNILLILLMLTLASSFCFAQQATPPTKPHAGKTSTQAVETKTLTGRVESVSLADPTKGTKSEIVIESPFEIKETKEKEAANENNQKTTFLVKSTTILYDANSNTITLDKIAKDQLVRIKYTTTKNGVNEATSIRIMK